MDNIVIKPLSDLAVAGILFSLVVSIVVPISLLIYGKVKLRARFMSAVIGAGVFMVFAMVLESLCHSLVKNVVGTLFENPWFLAVYGGLAAGLFEESGRYLAMRYAMKDKLDTNNALMYGFGHGGIEALFVGGLTAIANLAFANILNHGDIGSFLATVDAETQKVLVEQLTALSNVEAWMFFLSGIERLAALAVQVGLSCIVYLAARRNGKMNYFVIAIIIHALFDGCMSLLSSYIPIVAVEGLIIVTAAAICFVAYRFHQQEKDQPADIVM